MQRYGMDISRSFLDDAMVFSFSIEDSNEGLKGHTFRLAKTDDTISRLYEMFLENWDKYMIDTIGLEKDSDAIKKD